MPAKGSVSPWKPRAYQPHIEGEICLRGPVVGSGTMVQLRFDSNISSQSHHRSAVNLPFGIKLNALYEHSIITCMATASTSAQLSRQCLESCSNETATSKAKHALNSASAGMSLVIVKARCYAAYSVVCAGIELEKGLIMR